MENYFPIYETFVAVKNCGLSSQFIHLFEGITLTSIEAEVGQCLSGVKFGPFSSHAPLIFEIFKPK